ncbi:MAG TPA: ABC transporter ATP-binding protein [Acidimicrobiales bacterium]|nr:ABC transporter ATP-binding protein [Acidimicrobiales bacterium]
MLTRLPLADPGAPDTRSPVRFLLWLARRQLPTVVGGGVFGAVWMGAQGLIPAALGAAVDAVGRRNRAELYTWSAVVLGLGAIQAVAGVLRHRRAVTNFLTAAVRVQQLVARQASVLGADLTRHVDAGEVASIGTTDVQRIGRLLDVSARATGAVVSYAIIAALLFSSSWRLGLVLVVGAPVAAVLILPIMRPLERRQNAERSARAGASSVAADTVVGLRVLRGLGGEEVFGRRYTDASQTVRAATVRTALTQSLLDALQVFVPGAILVVITYFGAQMVQAGTISTGRLVAFYAYAAFLTLPVQTLIEAATRWSSATVAAGRVLTVLRRTPDLPRPPAPAPEPPAGPLTDPATGLVVEPGLLTVVAATDPEEASALAARLGRYVDGPGPGGGDGAGDDGLGHGPGDRPGEGAALAGTPLAALDLDVVRGRVLVVDREPQLLAGTVAAAVDVPAFRRRGDGTERPTVAEALDAAVATEIVDDLPDGLATELSERGRTLSGGQRQRIVLAATLRADPEVLVLDEPTSAVDAHTEADIAGRLHRVRRGRTTVVLSTSPYLLEHADVVCFVDDGRVAAVGRHGHLLATEARYRRLVTRGES